MLTIIWSIFEILYNYDRIKVLLLFENLASAYQAFREAQNLKSMYVWGVVYKVTIGLGLEGWNIPIASNLLSEPDNWLLQLFPENFEFTIKSFPWTYWTDTYAYAYLYIIGLWFVHW